MAKNESIFENEVKAIGILTKSEFDASVGQAGIGRALVMANNSIINITMWEKHNNGDSYKVVENHIKSLKQGDKYFVGGELSERVYEGEIRRDVTNKMISKEEVYNFNKVNEDSEEYSRCRLSGDILEKSMELTDYVRGETVSEEVEKLKITLGIYNVYNPETKKEDATRYNVLKREIENQISYLEKNDKDATKFKKILGTLEENKDDYDMFYSVLDEYREARNNNMFNINILHIVAYGDLATKLNDTVNKGDNVTFGCDINIETIMDEYGIVKGNLNEIEIKSFTGEVNEKSQLNNLEGEKDTKNVW